MGLPLRSRIRMDPEEDIEDDVFHPPELDRYPHTISGTFRHCSTSPRANPFFICQRFREVKYVDQSTQTTSNHVTSYSSMLPYGVQDEPSFLFYGTAAHRLHFPAHFEVDRDGDTEEGMAEEEQEPGLSAEAQIGQKLQRIGDQFHRDYTQMLQQNQRNPQPLWWRMAVTLLAFLFDRDAGPDRMDAR
ncbi:bcl-2-modifying factor-like isoform X1 [Polypterus senegalus]|uniref:bcl-2-modifying factor-like isoform X1 n=2 Tax=Polypterus senegalus TaxID=55291 RepID=UPI001964E79E|nr:bcl-2-modifying factor-like isoform X1 [Polypterus senegalus]